MPAQLVSLTEGPSILLDKPILLLGRHPECDIQIDSRKISRRHCCIAQVQDYLIVRDLASTNGIRINGVRVVEGRLKSGDEVTIGGHRYQVRWESIPALVVPPMARGRPNFKPAVSVQTPRDAEDDFLEESDEPVPLSDHERAVALSDPDPVALLSPADEKNPPPPGPDDSVPLPFEQQPPSRILPDQLELAPASDVNLRTPRPAS